MLQRRLDVILVLVRKQGKDLVLRHGGISYSLGGSLGRLEMTFQFGNLLPDGRQLVLGVAQDAPGFILGLVLLLQLLVVAASQVPELLKNKRRNLALDRGGGFGPVGCGELGHRLGQCISERDVSLGLGGEGRRRALRGSLLRRLGCIEGLDELFGPHTLCIHDMGTGTSSDQSTDALLCTRLRRKM